MKPLLTKAYRRIVPDRRPKPPDLSAVRPSRPVGRVVISGMGPRGVNAWKTWPDFFYPPFAFELSLAGIETVFAMSLPELVRACETPLETVVIHVYNEDYEEFPDVAEFDRRFPKLLVFNRAELGVNLGWKDKTHRLLTARGVPMPRLADQLEPGTPIFSNERRESKARILMLRKGDELDESRYNTEYVDTRRTYGGTSYLTAIRMLCVGRELVHAFAQASPESEGGYSARGKLMPFDAGFLKAIHDDLIGRRRAEIVDLAARLGEALGPGFFSHDVVVDRETDRLLVCESGFKFDHGDFREAWHAIAAHMADCELIFSPAQAARSGAAFLSECRRHGRFVAGPDIVPQFAADGVRGQPASGGVDAACERATV